MTAAAWRVFTELAPWLFLGAVVAGLLHAFLPAGFLRRRLSGPGGVANAVLLGVPLPLCSCSVIPTGLGLKKQGASDGATVGFLISTPQTGVDSILVTSAMLGLPLALFKVLVATATGLAGGWLTDRVARPTLPILASPTTERPRSGGRWRAATLHAVELVRSIWRWIVAGVLVSAAIETFLPTDGLASLRGGGGLIGMLAALLLALPLYVCATASVPIAASLVDAGLPTGAAMVFLMAGPATNVATIGAVFRTLGGRALAIYLATLTVGSILGGLAFGWLIDTGPTVAHDLSHTHTRPSPWWAVGSAIALAALFGWFAVEDLRRLWPRRRVPAAGPPTIVVAVEGMTCNACVARLEQVLNADPAVQSARVTLHPGSAEVTGDVTPPRLRGIIEEAGFSAR